MAIKNPRIFQHLPDEWYLEVQIYSTRQENFAAMLAAKKRCKDKKLSITISGQLALYGKDPQHGNWDVYSSSGPFKSRQSAESFLEQLKSIENGVEQHGACLAFGRSQISDQELSENKENMKHWESGGKIGLPALSSASQRRLDIALNRIKKRFEQEVLAVEHTGRRLQ